MRYPVQMTFDHMRPTLETQELIRAQAAKLEQRVPWLTSCHVVVAAPATVRAYVPYQVRIDLTLPGREIAVTKEPGPQTAAQGLHAIIRDAFNCARRQLEEHPARRRAR
jgi:hypothetical protein